MEGNTPWIRRVPDKECVREWALPVLTEKFGSDPKLTFAIVSQTGIVYSFGTEEDRAEAEEFCSPGHPSEEVLFLRDRP